MKKVSNYSSKIDVEGFLIPFINNVPVFMQNIDGKFLSIFTSKLKYEEAMNWLNIPETKCNAIVDGQQFLKCVRLLRKEEDFYIALNPYLTEDGNTRFELLDIGEDDESAA